MKRLARDPIRFDLINAFAEFGRIEKLSLRNPAAAEGFVERARASVNRSLLNEAFLHGIRTELMFESLVASLGTIEILKTEDSGEIYSSDDTLKVPDFRLVFSDHSQVLVEIKNFYQTNDARQAFELDSQYLDGLVRYSKAMSCKLFLGVHWARWNIWTLVAPEVFKNRGETRALDMLEAIKANHMAMLGDYSVGCRFPLSLIMHADKRQPRIIESDGKGAFVISKIDVCCAGQLIESPLERQIATYLMFYGKWRYEVIADVIDNQIETVEHRWSPERDNGQGFEILGSLGEMFSTFYKSVTQDEGQVRRLRIDVSPGSLGHLIPDNYKSEILPLWRFKQKPGEPGGVAEP
ncbi:MAG TPA: hypothetical protein VGU63_07155 [Candidatus Acidoferrales bacterium]|nr:hypothetical protein [Candidatus Acidoferrales bacterium]